MDDKLQWIHEQENEESTKQSREQYENAKLLKSLLCNCDDIDFLSGMKYSLGNIDFYVQLISSSIKQMKQSQDILDAAYAENNWEDIKKECHSLKSVLAYIGAIELSKESGILCAKENNSFEKLPSYINHLNNLCHELEQAIYAYNNSSKIVLKESKSDNVTETYMNECIDKILSHVHRFEYMEIVDGLEQLQGIVSNDKKDCVYNARSAISEFNYDKVEEILIDLKKDRGEAR